MDVSEILKCPVCRKIFTSPRQLPCQHNLCRSCLEGILSRARHGHFSCPFCRAEHVLPDGGAEMIPRSLILQQLLDVRESHSVTISSCRQATESLASDEITGVDERPSSVVLPSEEASNISLSFVCQVCTEMVGQCKICLHCGKSICEQCHENHMDLVRSAILNHHDHIQMTMSRIEEKQIATRSIIIENTEVASNGDIKRLFQLFEQKKHDMSPYLKSTQSVIDKTVGENELIAIMFQGEEHVIDMSEIEFNPLMLTLETQIEHHRNQSANFENLQPSSGIIYARNAQVQYNASAGVVLGVDLQNPRSNESGRYGSGQRGNYLATNADRNVEGQQSVNNCQLRNNYRSHTKCKESYLKWIVCFVAVIITGIRFGIGIRTSIEGGDIAIIVGILLIGKSVLDLILIFWVSMQKLEAVVMPSWKSALCAFAVLLNVLLSIVAAIFAYAPDSDVNTYEQIQRIVVGIDCVWSGCILITMLIYFYTNVFRFKIVSFKLLNSM